MVEKLCVIRVRYNEQICFHRSLVLVDKSFFFLSVVILAYIWPTIHSNPSPGVILFVTQTTHELHLQADNGIDLHVSGMNNI